MHYLNSKLIFLRFISLSLLINSTFVVGQTNVDLKKNKSIEANFQAVLKHYQNIGDTLKYKASKFIIENLRIHTSKTCIWVDETQKRVDYNELKYDDLEQAKKELKKLTQVGISPMLEVKYDYNVVTPEFLIENIDFSFKLWRDSPWYTSYNFEQFCEYVLPHRSLIEPLELKWKENYNIHFREALKNAADVNNPVDVCTAVIEKMKYFEFNPSRDYPQPILSPSQLLFRREGSCPDLANAALLACRSLGVAATFDFTPFYAASSNSHYWNTVINSDGEHIPFSGNQNIPYDYNANNKRMAKVFRHTYSNQKKALANLVPLKQIPTYSLRMPNVIDVTAEYVETINIPYKYKNPNKKGLDIGYIQVFNRGSWRPIWWDNKKNNGEVIFKNMGINCVYLPASFIKDSISNKYQLKKENFPLLINKDKNVKILKPNFLETFECTISRNNEITANNQDYNTLEIFNEAYYKLYYWDTKWKLLIQKVAVNESLTFKNLPKNALFRLIPEKEDYFERIFSIDERSCTISWY